MYLKSQCARNHGNQVQSQPHGSEPLSPQNKKRKEKRKNQRSHKKRKREKPCIPVKRQEKAQESHVHPRKPLSPNQTEPKTKNQKTKNLRTKEPKHPKHPRPDQQPSPDALCTDPTKTKPPTPIYEKSTNLPLLTPGPKSPCQSLLGIGRASTIGVAQRLETGLAIAAPRSTQPRTPMSTLAGGNPSETSDPSPPLTTGRAVAGLMSSARNLIGGARACPPLGNIHTEVMAASGTEKGMTLWGSGL